MMKKLMIRKQVLLGILVLVAVGIAFAASAFGVLQKIIVVPEEKGISLSISAKLSVKQMKAAEDIALADARVQAMLEGADYYKTQVSGVVNINASEVRVEDGKRIIYIDFEKEKAIVQIHIYKEYDQGLGIKTCLVTVDLTKGEVTEIREYPEVKPQPKSD